MTINEALCMLALRQRSIYIDCFGSVRFSWWSPSVMMKSIELLKWTIGWFALVITGPIWAQQPRVVPNLLQTPAVVVAGADQAMMLGAARAGRRIVAVGDHGVILLSDDGGKKFRQAKAVPTRATLNAVHFVSEQEGWVVGHWGVVLHTADGGEVWTMQRNDLLSDKPLFSVWFQNHSVGFAVGLWGLMLRTADGGKLWQEVPLLPMTGKAKPSDRNLNAFFPAPNGDLFIGAESGTVFKSRDGGETWEEINTGSTGSFWTGLTLKSGVVLVAGLRGRILRSDDGGSHWTAANADTKSSITAMTQLPDGRIVAVGLDGIFLESADDGRSFSLTTRNDRLPLTMIVPNAYGEPVVFSANGVVPAK